MKRRKSHVEAPVPAADRPDSSHNLSVSQLVGPDKLVGLNQLVGPDTWLAILWMINIASFVPRQQMLLDYATLAGMPPWLEPLTVPPGWLVVLVAVAGSWWWRMQHLGQTGRVAQARCWLTISLLPLLVNFLRAVWPDLAPSASIFEPLWAAAFSGATLFALWPADRDTQLDTTETDGDLAPQPSMAFFGERHAASWHHLTIGLSCVFAAGWWWYQAHDYYTHFMLGFNDFGHFTQRIAATVQGRGFLIESPVLPTYWDHFNPGLALIAPVWKLWPSVEVIFALHAISLAASGWLLARIALALGANRGVAAIWALVWLLHPNVSQMNVAYTYGWHPVCLAIPLLLVSILKTIRRQHVAACASAILACSMEETVIVIVSAYCAARAFALAYRQWRCSGTTGTVDWESQLAGGWRSITWWGASLVGAMVFVGVYHWSGLATFQTARFTSLGDNAWTILASPVLRPTAFWGQLLSYRNLAFVACLAVPLFPIAARATWSIWVATLLPLGVLMVWDHNPAKSIAFHYPATILPIWMVAAIVGAQWWRGGRKSTALSASALLICLLLSKYLGQMPWTGPMLNDVIWSTYPTAGLDFRAPETPAGRWLTEQADDLRSRGEPVLATGRAAAHLIGCAEVETVGQFHERRERLQALTPTISPLLRYRYLLFDRSEYFQQTAEDIERLEREAASLGFQVRDDRHDIVVLER